MAFDYGTKRIGIAVTDPLQIIATALTTIHPNQVIEFLKTYMQQEAISKFVIGMPRQLDGKPSQSATHVVGFTRLLKKHFPTVEQILIDERFTSKMAADVLVKSGMRKTQRSEKGHLDRISAVILLQDYMESIHLQ